MKTIFFNSMLSFLILTSCQFNKSNNTDSEQDLQSAVENSLSAEEQEAGWILLFDGVSTQGWRNYGEDTIGSAWKVVNGMLFLEIEDDSKMAEKGGDIIYDQIFEEFHLKLDWKISEAGNSGIIFLVHEDRNSYNHPWQSGPEMQILDNDLHPDGKIEKHRAGDLYDMIAAKPATNPVGSWNEAEIIVQEQTLRFRLNGEEILKTTLWDETWTELIQNSKFSSMSGFGTYRKGVIALQDHGDQVWFKNIKIRPL